LNWSRCVSYIIFILVLPFSRILQKPKNFMDHPGNPWHHPMAGHAHHQQLAAAAQLAAAQMAANSASGGNDDKPFSAMMARAHHQGMTGGPGGPNPFLAAAAAQHSAMGLGPLPGPGSKVMSSHSSGPAPPPFRFVFSQIFFTAFNDDI
jgi:hypothetical protein